MTWTLRPYQREAIDSVYDYWAEEGGNPLIVLPTGCHAAGTRVLRASGEAVAVEDVRVGDTLLGPSGAVRTVLRLARGREEMFRVTPKRGAPFVVNAGHILALKTTNEGKPFACNTTGREIEFATVREWTKRSKSWRHLRKLWRSPSVDFARPESARPVPAWVLGALIGDGYMERQPNITTPDVEVDAELSAYCASIGLSRRVERKPDNAAWGVYYFTARGKPNPLTDMLRGIGAWGCLAADKSVPDAYKFAPEAERLEMLAGLMDTDGHLNDSAGFEFSSASERLARDVQFMARSVGLYASELRQKMVRGGTYWLVGIYGDTDRIPTRVPRKQAPPRRQKKDALKTGFTVESVGEGDFYGFELDGDHLYLTEDFFVHHNTGKSGVAGTLTRELITDYADMRILNVTHVAELVGQNHAELMSMWDWAPAGIYSAGLGKRDLASQVLFAGIQSIHTKVDRLGTVDLMMVDEAHLIPRNDDTMYGRFIAACREANPDMRLIGLTATPYRTDSGRLDEPTTKKGVEMPPMFDAVAYEYSIRAAIDDGYLTPLISKATATALDTTGVSKRGGEYVASALQAAVDKDDLNRGIVDDIVRYGQDRRSWLVFASGVEHAAHLRDEIRRRGYSAEMVDGTTPPGDRRRIINGFKGYNIRALVNCGVLTTGFNHPGVDLIAAARPTESTGLYVQIAGRGTRNVYAPGMPLGTREERLAAIAAGPKPNCLFLDFGGLVQRHGPVDIVKPRKPGSGEGDAPVKTCPECFSLIHASLMQCPDCGHEFERELSKKITKNAAASPILSVGNATWKTVGHRRFARHEKFGGFPSMRVEYVTDAGGNLSGAGGAAFKEWIGFENPKAAGLAARWWKQHGGAEPMPKTTSEALQRAGELRPVSEIRIEPSGKFWRITGRRFAVGAEAGNADPVEHRDAYAEANRPAGGDYAKPWEGKAALTGGAKPLDLEDDDIPF